MARESVGVAAVPTRRLLLGQIGEVRRKAERTEEQFVDLRVVGHTPLETQDAKVILARVGCRFAVEMKLLDDNLSQ